VHRLVCLSTASAIGYGVLTAASAIDYGTVLPGAAGVEKSSGLLRVSYTHAIHLKINE
jgi:hypothetical protein